MPVTLATIFGRGLHPCQISRRNPALQAGVRLHRPEGRGFKPEFVYDETNCMPIGLPGPSAPADTCFRGRRKKQDREYA